MSDTLDDLLRASAELRASPHPAADPPHDPAGQPPADAPPSSRPDFEREHRKGVPEVVYTPGKTVAQSLEMARALLERTGRALLSRASPELEASLREAFPGAELEVHAASRMCVLKRPGYRGPATGGCVGVLTAGTSDIPIAEEAAVVAAEMGCRVVRAYDVGVAGLHRLTGPLRELARQRVDVVIVAAGMDGALPSVVSGLVDVAVIGLPTSVGYGLGGQGVGALMSMLQTCSPGLSVVNIDNGVGAGATAALIANRVAAARASGG